LIGSMTCGVGCGLRVRMLACKKKK
jgi:hypothetical protein